MHIDKLVQCFDLAIEHKKKYVALMYISDHKIKPEIVIIQTEDFLQELQKCRAIYNDNCELKMRTSNKIKSCTCTNRFVTIEKWVKSNEA